MKKIIDTWGAPVGVVTVIVLFGWLLFTAIAAEQKKEHQAGLNRVVTLYTADGRVMQTWHPDGGYVDFGSGAASFRVDGKRVKVSGTIVFETKREPAI
jgi:hypothetical protein